MKLGNYGGFMGFNRTRKASGVRRDSRSGSITKVKSHMKVQSIQEVLNARSFIVLITSQRGIGCLFKLILSPIIFKLMKVILVFLDCTASGLPFKSEAGYVGMKGVMQVAVRGLDVETFFSRFSHLFLNLNILLGFGGTKYV